MAAVVLAHGFIFNKESWSEQASTLANNGFQVLAIDSRGYGKSYGGEQTGSGSNLYLDVIAAVDYLLSLKEIR
ncbi:MAG: alpha-beta hydrolase superfamily lysophospholipase [Myxococcota bacterium]|jgi:alpha-beta hydrolase superfamily lysophospholipase